MGFNSGFKGLNKTLFNYSGTNSRGKQGTRADKHNDGSIGSYSTNLCKETQCTISRISF